MAQLNSFLEGLPETHAASLQWFEDRKGQRVSWAEMKELAEQEGGMRLSTAAKGIYKPAYTDYALSVRTVQDGPYPDKDVEHRPDGSWVCQYYQENQDPALRDTQATNRGLMLCMENEVPVGFLIKRQSKPRAEYDVLGVGFVTSWNDGYFTIEGLSDDGEFKTDRSQSDAATSRTRLLSDPQNEELLGAYDDNREFQIRSVAMRRGQSAFRNGLLVAYGSQCCISGCDVPAALEAAHIAPYLGEHSNKVNNGLLLRSDLHTLFDLGLLAVNANYRIHLAPELLYSGQYSSYKNKVIALPSDKSNWPDPSALANHQKWAGFE
ncbi:HNH endonuclease [Phaeobacter gallaeciensis]|uniref:HNH endonuclease n=1 Tax=Phaeobacter gallaeciensis TaxID=60890 RepID=UPI00237F6578|nr:HNH endonuclease signature motif containing protein [Phaeobacter gallaeciensis]MDE4096749.1 HNH endonuclease signature motif containing protein [Phaeobacter gallaeciensis]MDE4105957.1 HNH endonuclease signature motif containing protein [Phaeobacter gallaeciensis]MDE4110016.1 HNH endonuclease signature motif containing protein [Phaeobacter gallaeciensis]MDE4114484.1 HNH endonuclease signature motif containing protein [Phaeobacter gallaeciensis]MDE4119350.1 HNH endonuclease signature motif co